MTPKTLAVPDRQLASVFQVHPVCLSQVPDDPRGVLPGEINGNTSLGDLLGLHEPLRVDPVTSLVRHNQVNLTILLVNTELDDFGCLSWCSLLDLSDLALHPVNASAGLGERHPSTVTWGPDVQLVDRKQLPQPVILTGVQLILSEQVLQVIDLTISSVLVSGGAVASVRVHLCCLPRSCSCLRVHHTTAPTWCTGFIYQLLKPSSSGTSPHGVSTSSCPSGSTARSVPGMLNAKLPSNGSKLI